MKREERHKLTLETRRKELILATLESIRKHGFLNSTIKTISAESNLSRGLISHYFEGKDELLFAAFQHLTDHQDSVYRQMQTAAGHDPFRRLLAAAMTPFMPYPTHPCIWLHFWSAALLDQRALDHHRNLWGRYRASIERRIAAAAADRNLEIDVKENAIVFTQLMDGLFMGLVLEEVYDRETCQRIMRNWLCNLFREDPANHPMEPLLEPAAGEPAKAAD